MSIPAQKYDSEKLAVLIPRAIEEIKELFDLDAVITLDFETYYRSKGTAKQKSYSLTNKTYWEYINHPEFAITQFAYCEDNGEIEVLHPAEVGFYLNSLKARREAGERIAIVAQNTEFDACICNWKFGLTFDVYLDTMLMCKQQYTGMKFGLAAQCVRMFSDADWQKGKELVQADDVHDYMEAGIWDSMAGYNKQDVRLTRGLLAVYWMNRRTPILEWFIMSYTLRGCVEDQFLLDVDLLAATEAEGILEKKSAIEAGIAQAAEHGITAKPISFSSDMQFAELVQSLGMSVPKKVDKKTNEIKPALAQTDPAFVEMRQEHPELAAIWLARKHAKSNIKTSRAKKMRECAETLNRGNRIGFYLQYNAAHTGRFSGGAKLNQQNLQQGSNHRLAQQAPEGYVIGVVDLSNIELRVNLWFCGEDELQAENDKGDLYCTMASGIYGEVVPPKSEWQEDGKKLYNTKRQIGKICELGMQYGMSARAFQAYLAGGPMGMEPVFFPMDFCKQVKTAYNVLHPKVVQMWKDFDRLVLPTLAGFSSPITIGRNNSVKVRRGEIELPSGRILCYPAMKAQVVDTEWGIRNVYTYDDGTRDGQGRVVPAYTYGAKVFQNVIQAMARDVICYHQYKAEQTLQQEEWGWVSGSVHDELLCMIAEDAADEGFEAVTSIMRQPPNWCKEIPLDTEGGWAKEYSK